MISRCVLFDGWWWCVGDFAPSNLNFDGESLIKCGREGCCAAKCGTRERDEENSQNSDDVNKRCRIQLRSYHVQRCNNTMQSLTALRDRKVFRFPRDWMCRFRDLWILSHGIRAIPAFLKNNNAQGRLKIETCFTVQISILR